MLELASCQPLCAFLQILPGLRQAARADDADDDGHHQDGQANTDQGTLQNADEFQRLIER